MQNMNMEPENKLIADAVAGDRKALETLLMDIEDTVFNLSLRMLGMVADAQDATQEILIRVMTNLSSFRQESSFKTWVYRISVNYLINYKKSMFAQHPMDFDFYGNDIRACQTDQIDMLIDDMTRNALADELKMACTNVMLQCLDAQSRVIFILGTMFRVDSRAAGEILEMTPENYRQKLSRIRKKVAAFLVDYCGLTDTGFCSCSRRVPYAIEQHRIQPEKPEYRTLEILDKAVLGECMEEMEKLDELSLTFEDFPVYKSCVNTHKNENKAAVQDFETLIHELMMEIGKWDSSILGYKPKELTFKLMRDTRFFHDKSPYQPAFRCHISSMGKLPVPVGYFLYIQPGSRSFLGGGLFADMFKNATTSVREYIFNHQEVFLEIIHAPDFAARFKVDGTALKNVPKEYPADCSVAEYLKFKSFYIEYSVADELFKDMPGFVSYAAENFRLMKPFNDFLNQALDGFTMPER